MTPASFFTAWAYITLILGILFLLIQTFILVAFAWAWAEKWIGYYDERQDPCWRIALIGTTFFAYSISIAGIVVLWVFFGTGDGCGLNIFFLCSAIVFILVFSIVSILPRVQEAASQSGLLQSSILGAYLVYVLASALSSEPSDYSCAKDSSSDTFGQALFYIGFAGTFISLCGQAFSTSSSDAFGSEGDPEADDEKEEVKYEYYVFHLVFMMAGGYMAVLLTNWSIVTGQQPDGEFTVDSGFGAVWAKMATSWIVALIYIWTLVAPIIWPSRFARD